MPEIRKDSIAAAVSDVARRVARDHDRQTIFDSTDETDHTEVLPGTTVGGNRQKPFAAGTGKGTHGVAFTNIPQGFFPSQLVAANLSDIDSGTPTLPRAGSGTPRFISTVQYDGMAVYLQWAPPLVDTNGRWLIAFHQDVASGQQSTVDMIDTYLITREAQDATGTIVTVGAVSHNDQYISEIMGLLTAAGKVTTDPKTHNATFDPSVIVGGIITPPPANERYFYFTDRTAQYGKTYKYYIVAITQAQVESDSLTIIPGTSQSEGTLDLQVPTVWASSYPELTPTDITKSGANFAVIAGGITSQVEVGYVAIMANALTINTTPNPANDPHVEASQPTEVKLIRPTTGSLDQIIEFQGANMELAGGITGISFATGITMKTPLASNIVKVRVGSTDSWTYQVRMTVASTANLGPLTMNITCSNGMTAMCSTIKVVDQTGTTTDGATFTSDPLYDLGANIDQVIDGQNMDRIDKIAIYKADKTTLKGYGTLVMQSANYIEFTYTGLPIGTYWVQATYQTPFGTTGKDGITLTIRSGREPLGDNGTANNTTTGVGFRGNDARSQ